MQTWVHTQRTKPGMAGGCRRAGFTAPEVQDLHLLPQLLPVERLPGARGKNGLASLVRIACIMKNPRGANPPDHQGPMPPSLEILQEHRRHKRSSWKHLRSTRYLVILSSLLIYACVVPFLLVHASVAVYQLVCFPIYGIPKVRRQDYLVFDRGRLAYLNTIEKIGCIYCSYVNGLLAMITEIAARTEQHFCPIKHARRLAQTHSRYGKFPPYGDARAYREQSDAVARAYSDLEASGK